MVDTEPTDTLSANLGSAEEFEGDELEAGGFGDDGPDIEPARGATVWPSMHERLVALIDAHRSTIIFVNSRRLAERLMPRSTTAPGGSSLIPTRFPAQRCAPRPKIS